MIDMAKPNTVIITGAAGAIGKAVARVLDEWGYRLLLVDKDAEALQQVATLIPKCDWAAIDVTDAYAISTLFDKVAEDLISVVLAAGIEGPVGSLEACPDNLFQTVMDTNVMSVWLGIKHALRIFKPKGYGNIVVLSSISGVNAMPMLSPYCASKHAVMGLVKTAAREVAGYGVRINAVCPGPVESNMMQRIDSALAEIYPARADASQFIPIQRYATPEEVANIIRFLCADESS